MESKIPDEGENMLDVKSITPSSCGKVDMDDGRRDRSLDNNITQNQNNHWG